MDKYFFSKFNFSDEYRNQMIEFVRRMSNAEIGGYKLFDGTGTHYMQNAVEITDFIRFTKELESQRGKKFESFLEIGFSAGINNTFVNKFFNFSNIVAVDIMQPTPIDPRTFMTNLRFKNISLFVGDSTSENIINKVKTLGGYDLIFIDGCHEYEYVKKDFYNYSKILNEGGVIGLHDIRATGFPGSTKFWNELREQEAHLWNFKELWDKGNHTDYGIGVIYK